MLVENFTCIPQLIYNQQMIVMYDLLTIDALLRDSTEFLTIGDNGNDALASSENIEGASVNNNEPLQKTDSKIPCNITYCETLHQSIYLSNN